MNAMSPWGPREIEALTPLQLLCMGSEEPPDAPTIRSVEEWQEMMRAMPRWDEVPA